jgi:putative two-component system response regulator
MQNQQKSRVLIVDDAPENIRILAESLKTAYAIMFARNGESALNLANSSPMPDIILLDVIMPGLSGYEVCKQLKDNPATAGIPVIFITSQSDEDDEARGLELGAVDYISKPFRSSLVMTRVTNQLELKKHRDMLDDLVRERTKEIVQIKEVTIIAMATLAEWRDPETGGHIKRTQNYVRALAKKMATLERYSAQLDRDTIDLLYQSAPLHDIGKVSTPDAVLLKAGRLTPDEFEIMRQHTTRGGDALANIERNLGKNSFLRIAREIAYGHHEHWDGNGYPQGINGADIPLPARIMALADIYDALVSKRVYKPAMSHEQAVTIICEGRGTHLDPDVVDAFLAVQSEFINICEQFKDTEAGQAEEAARSG